MGRHLAAQAVEEALALLLEGGAPGADGAHHHRCDQEHDQPLEDAPDHGGTTAHAAAPTLAHGPLAGNDHLLLPVEDPLPPREWGCDGSRDERRAATSAELPGGSVALAALPADEVARLDAPWCLGRCGRCGPWPLGRGLDRLRLRRLRDRKST